jgi:hypothetical protein
MAKFLQTVCFYQAPGQNVERAHEQQGALADSEFRSGVRAFAAYLRHQVSDPDSPSERWDREFEVRMQVLDRYRPTKTTASAGYGDNRRAKPL